MRATTCPLCQRRRARRACPALGFQICPVCCGTKRLTEIRCPDDCCYLKSTKAHPPAMVQRQQERDGRFVVPIVAGLSERQFELFFLVQSALLQLAESGELPVDDEVVRDAMQALAATCETAGKGIIYEHRPASLHAERLARELQWLVEGRDGQRPVANERDLAEVFRRIAQAAGQAGTVLDGGNRAYLNLAGRLMQFAPGTAPGDPNAASVSRSPSMIIP